MLSKQSEQIIAATEQFVRQQLAQEHSGHDIAHIIRVVNLAKYLLKTTPKADPFIVIMAAYLHDVIDDKLFDDLVQARATLLHFLLGQRVTAGQQTAIMAIIDNMSFSQNLQQKQLLSLEGQLVQDADRLDALGAIGIARTFYYGGHKKHAMYDPTILPRTEMDKQTYRQPSTVINHFHEKLLLLSQQMNTPAAQKLAQKRHQLLQNFLSEFMDEWHSKLD